MAKPVTDVYQKPDLRFYREQSDISSPGEFGYLFAELPATAQELCRLVQNLLLHQFWILDKDNYGVSAASLKAVGRDLDAEINLRSTTDILDHVMQLDDGPLAAPRDLECRVVGNCRDYSLLCVSMLRHQGIPVRVRSGVARYFYQDGHLEDHFICEFWNRAQGRWQQTDAQIDDVQLRTLNIEMDMADLPPGQFLNAGEAFAELSEGRVAPEKIGIFEYKGTPYVHGKLVSDLACVSGVEVLPWEGWGICADIDSSTLSTDDLALLDKIATILMRMNTDSDQFQRARELFCSHPRLRMPEHYEPYFFELPAFK